MDVQEYIASGILELYVAGVLSEKENLEIGRYAQEYPEIKKEIVSIEAAVLELTNRANIIRPHNFDNIRSQIGLSDAGDQVVPINKTGASWTQYLGWAAAILFAIGLLGLYYQNNDLKSQLELVERQNQELEQQIADSNTSLEKTQDLLNTLRDRNISVIPLGGQEVSPNSYAKAYWNKEDKKVLIDAQGLPEPPDGFVYQVWSLKLTPLTPTSVGLLEDFKSDDNKVFTLSNPNDSEAFGITLEPAGGSETPTLEQLYALGVVSAS